MNSPYPKNINFYARPQSSLSQSRTPVRYDFSQSSLAKSSMYSPLSQYRAPSSNIDHQDHHYQRPMIRSSSMIPPKQQLRNSTQSLSPQRNLHDKFLSPENVVKIPGKISYQNTPKNFLFHQPFLPPKKQNNKKTLILDLDETLVHSSFKPFPFHPDIGLHIAVNNKTHTVNVLKRPYVNEFLSKMSQLYELVIFTASVAPYANPLLDRLDENRVIAYRLFRQHCINMSGAYIKDLRKVGRDLKDTIILDNNPISYVVNKENGIPILTWHYDKSDKELLKIIPLLEKLSRVSDVRTVIKKIVKNNVIDYKEVSRIFSEENKSKSSSSTSHSSNSNLKKKHMIDKISKVDKAEYYYVASASQKSATTKSTHNHNMISQSHVNLTGQNGSQTYLSQKNLDLVSQPMTNSIHLKSSTPLNKNININIVNQQVSNFYVKYPPKTSINNFIEKNKNHKLEHSIEFDYNERDKNYLFCNRNNEQPVTINSSSYNYRYSDHQKGNSTIVTNSRAGYTNISGFDKSLIASPYNQNNRSCYLQERENNLRFPSRNERNYTPLRGGNNLQSSYTSGFNKTQLRNSSACIRERRYKDNFFHMM